MGSIYKITNTANGKSYVGQTIHDAVKGRISEHLNGKSGGSRLVRRAIEKYGKDAFTYEILHDGIIPEFLDDLEIEAIKKFNTIAPHGYNLKTGGEGGSLSEETCRRISKANKGRKRAPHSEETKRKLSEANKGKTFSEETRRKISQAHKGKTLSEEHRRNMSEARKGKKQGPHSEETKRKISQAHKGKKRAPLSEETRRKISEANKGRKHTEESRRNMSEAQKGKILSEEHRRKISEVGKGRTHSEETRRKISEVGKGRTHSEETRRKISKSHKGKVNSEESRRKMSESHKGKILSEEHRRKISETNESDRCKASRKIFFSLPSGMDLKKKRKILRERFSDTSDSTIYRWCEKFDLEQSAATRLKSPPVR